MTVYSVSKAAVIMLTQCMASFEERSNVRVVALAPNFVNTGARNSVACVGVHRRRRTVRAPSPNPSAGMVAPFMALPVMAKTVEKQGGGVGYHEPAAAGFALAAFLDDPALYKGGTVATLTNNHGRVELNPIPPSRFASATECFAFTGYGAADFQEMDGFVLDCVGAGALPGWSTPVVAPAAK